MVVLEYKHVKMVFGVLDLTLGPLLQQLHCCLAKTTPTFGESRCCQAFRLFDTIFNESRLQYYDHEIQYI